MTPAIPSYLQGNPASASQAYLGQLPSLFNTSGVKQAYGTQIQGMFDQGRALAAAAANQYTQRARQNGASTLGAGFAQASAMLPVYQQGFAAQGDLQKLLLQSRAQQAQIGAGLSSNIGQLQNQHQSTLADYFMNQQRMGQQQGQFNAQLNQSGSQFGQDYNLRALSLAAQLQKQGFNGGAFGGGGGTGAFNPGYVPNSGPLSPGTGGRVYGAYPSNW